LGKGGEQYSLGAVKWLGKSILQFFEYPVELSPMLLAASMMLLGAVGVLKSDKKKFLLLVIPIILVIVASGLRKFPFHGRFVIFLLPTILLFISEGIRMLMNKGKVGLFLGIMVFCILLAQPLKNAILQAINPQEREEMRPVVSFLKENQLPGDSLLMNNSAQHGYSYYLKYQKLTFSPVRMGYFYDAAQQDSIPLILETKTSQGKIFSLAHVRRQDSILPDGLRSKRRTWLLLSHLDNQETERFIKACFDDRGKMLLEFRRTGASIYLYELYQPLATIKQAVVNYKLKNNQ
jgi:hypothetical protein